jgi:putative AbiEi antitoxin of type IV toxin-antitoxin system
MDPRVLATMANHHGLITSRELIKLGHGADVVRRWTRDGLVVPVRRGVYTLPEMWESWDEFTQRPLARARAAHYTMRTPHVMSHDSSALGQVR